MSACIFQAHSVSASVKWKLRLIERVLAQCSSGHLSDLYILFMSITWHLLLRHRFWHHIHAAHNVMV